MTKRYIQVARSRKQTKAKRVSVKAMQSGKIRVGIICGKNFDPIPRGTHDRNYPEWAKFKNNTGPNASGWGGMYHIDVSLGLKVARMYPDLFKLDIMGFDKKPITRARLRRNHVNLNMIEDVVITTYKHGRKAGKEMMRAFQDPQCRMWPSWDYYDWVCTKPRYMKQCQNAGIPIIDTIFVTNGFEPHKVLKKVQAKGWDRFFVKAGAYVCFGNAAIHGKTADFVNDPSLLQKFARDNKKEKVFLVQPYVLKPNGNVFDEVRNFFIDGQWAYSVYTDGTDDDAVYEQPPGALKTACMELSKRAYKEVLKIAKWQGEPMVPLMCRIDIGIVPDSSQPRGFRIFLNEIETEVSTWLARYAPFNLCDRMAEATIKKIRQLLLGLLVGGVKVPDVEKIQRVLSVLEDRLGPLRN